MKVRKLTPKQARFVAAYCGNATEAALKAGYSPKTARIMGAENLTKPNIQEVLKEREDKRLASLIATREERQVFWSETMKSETVDMAARLKASELLGRSECDFIDRSKVDVTVRFGLADLLEDGNDGNDS